MLHWYCKVTIILRKIKNAKETIIVRWKEYNGYDVLIEAYRLLKFSIDGPHCCLTDPS